jgi:hypothetical protein
MKHSDVPNPVMTPAETKRPPTFFRAKLLMNCPAARKIIPPRHVALAPNLRSVNALSKAKMDTLPIAIAPMNDRVAVDEILDATRFVCITPHE